MTTAVLPTHSIEKCADAELPFVSVIIPVRNDAQRLAVCLQSLAEVDYPAACYEVIVIDNGSSDASVATARAAEAKVLIHPDLRVGALRNRGVAVARGDILALVDSDHEVPPNWLRTGVGELSADLELSMVGSPCLAPPHGTWVQRVWELHRLRNVGRRSVDWLGAGNLFIRKHAFERINGFDETLVAAEDVDLCVRLKRVSGRIVSDMRVANIHHGEPRTLWQFFRKELRRGSSGIRAFIAHGMPLRELPSLLFPLYHLLALALLVASGVAVACGASSQWMAAALSMLLLPAALLAVKTSLQVSQPLVMPPLAILYFTYGLARAAALFPR